MLTNKEWVISHTSTCNRNSDSPLPFQAGPPQVWLHPQAGGVRGQQWWWHTPRAPRAGRHSFPGFKETCSSPGRALPHILSLYWTESDHMASPEPLTMKECKPNKPIPEAKVRLHREGWHLLVSKTEALFGRRWMLQRHQRASSTGLPTRARCRPEMKIGDPEDKPSQRQLLQPSWYNSSNRVISKIFKLGAVRWNLRTPLSLEILEWCNTDSSLPVQQPAKPTRAGLSGEEARWPVLQSGHSLWLRLPHSFPSAAEPRGHLV